MQVTGTAREVTLAVTEFLTSDTTTAKITRLLVTIHGIRDEGSWNARLSQIMALHGYRCVVCPVKYPRYSGVLFILGIGRSKIVSRTLDQLRYYLNKYPNAIVDVLCHSNGTKILSEILPRVVCHFHYIIFIGSICKRDDARNILEKSEFFVNDCGIKDRWPILATAIRPDLFEETGVVGFQFGGANDRFFEFGHSDGLKRNHLVKFILPLLMFNDLTVLVDVEPDLRWHNSTYYRRFLIFAGVIIAAVAFMWCYGWLS